MFDWVGLLIQLAYYYGYVIGVRSFEFDWRTGRVFTRTRSTLYAMAANVTIVIVLGFSLIRKETFFVVFCKMNKLYGSVVFIVVILRTTTGLVILLNQWRLQSQLMIVARKAIQICLTRPQTISISRRRILFKFLNGLLIDILPLLISVAYIDFDKLFPGIFLHFWISTIINLVAAEYFLVILCVRENYHLLNADLKKVIEESKYLSYNPSRRGTYMTRCCALADQLEDIAKRQSQLQSIVGHLSVAVGIETLLSYCCYYVSSLFISYLCYNIFKHEPKVLGLNLRGSILTLAWSIFFHIDAIHLLFMEFHVLDGQQELIRLLNERTLFASAFDARLEESFECLQLQLTRNPLEMHVLHLFPINRNSMWAMYASIVLHSIYIVQYELENFGAS
ncbi:hypothetical protein KR038_001178 [Drosophila bunnanda]|nr:hypothetical protein KR038_001178 [Drosophila bunnanda]